MKSFSTVFWWRPRRLLANSWKEEGLLALAGFFGGSLYFYTENTALGMTQASNVAFLLCTAPLLTAFLSAACYKEVRLGIRLLAGSLLALCGVGLIVFGGKEGLKVSPWGDLLTLSAAFSWACYRFAGCRIIRCRSSPGKCFSMDWSPYCPCLRSFRFVAIWGYCRNRPCG